jgi:hypothetical protein
MYFKAHCSDVRIQAGLERLSSSLFEVSPSSDNKLSIRSFDTIIELWWDGQMHHCNLRQKAEAGRPRDRIEGQKQPSRDVASDSILKRFHSNAADTSKMHPLLQQQQSQLRIGAAA